MSTQVLTICGIAFAAVFGLLTILSITQRLITWYFPAPEQKLAGLSTAAAAPAPEAAPAAGQTTDPTVVAVITSTVMNLYPNARVTRIEEER